MKLSRTAAAFALTVLCACCACSHSTISPAPSPEATCQPCAIDASSLYDLNAVTIDGKAVSLSQYAGKVSLVVNTASFCGMTPQYAELQQLFTRYKDRGFVILAFPSADFGGQEFDSNQEIQNFCSTKYNITFPLFQRDHVRGCAKQPVFAFLTQNCAEDYKGEIGWNFEKFLVDRHGSLRERWGSFTNPLSTPVTEAIDRLLNEKP